MRQEPRLKPQESTDLQSEIAALRREVKRLNDHRFIRVQNSTPRLLSYMFLRGLALGLGTVVGASVLVSIVAFFLAQIDFLPLIGDWASDFARQIEAEVRARQDGSIAPGSPEGTVDGVDQTAQ